MTKEEQEKLAVENENLIYHTIRMLGFNESNYNFDELISIGWFSLAKAIKNYDKNKATFSTYCVNVIKNDLLCFLNKENKILNSSFSLDIIMEKNVYSESNNGWVDDELNKSSTHFIDIYNKLDFDYKPVFDLYLHNYSYKEISEKLSITEKEVQDSIRKSKIFLRKYFKNILML